MLPTIITPLEGTTNGKAAAGAGARLPPASGPQRLLEEHRPMIEVLDVLVREATMVDRIGDDFRRRVAEWAELLRRHEAEENTFVEDAFNQEIGAER
jgi:hypothetical protein